MTANAQASYNKDYKAGVEVAEGDNYFLYNIGSKMFLTGGMDWGSRASGDHAGKVVTLALNDGKYTIYTAYFSENGMSNSGYLGTNSYTDADDAGKASCVFTPVSVDGYTNAYTIKNGDNFLFYNSADTRVNWGASTGDNYSYWLIVPKTNRDAVGDYTYYLQNQGNNRPWERQVWCGYDWDQNNRGEWKNWEHNGWSNHPYYTVGGSESNPCVEKYHQTFDFYQTISQTLPEGRYRLYAQAFWRDGSSGETYLYMGDAQQPIGKLNANGENTEESMAGASTAFSAGQYVNSVEKFFSIDTKDVKIGINMTTANQWVIFDNFALDYLGKLVSDYAVALPEGGAMTANTWYYFDISTAADNYAVTATTLEGVVCTSDGNSLTAEATGNITLKAENNTFAAQRYYVKSTSANNLKISVASYSYELGVATLSVADGKYTQTQTFTVTFPDAASNDPSASAELVAGSKATVNGAEVTLTAVTNGFSIDLGELTTSTDYAISIPDNVYGYVGESMNSATNLTIHTPIVFDGTFFLYNDLTKSFLARGMDYGTRAVIDKYGVPVYMATNENGLSTLKFVDNDLYLGNTWWMYTDISTANTFKVIPSTVEGASGYHFATQEVSSNLPDKKYMYVYLKDDTDKYACAGNSTMEENITDWKQTVWQLKSVTERDAIIANYPTDNIQNVISASGISSTPAEFETYLSEHYKAIEKTSNIGTATFAGSVGDWTWSQVRGQDGQPTYGENFAEVWNATGSFTQTIDKANLPAGIYKVTVQGYERRKDNTASANLYNAGYKLVSTYLAANDEKVRFTDWNEVADKPISKEAAVSAFEKGEAVNTVYVYLDGSTDLTITVKKPNYIWDNWAIFNNFTLTYYQPVENITITDAGYATYCSTNALDFSGTGIKVYRATAAAGKVTFHEITSGKVAGSNGLLLKGAEGTYEVPVITDGENEANMLTGVLTATDIDAGNFVLLNGAKGVGFYKTTKTFTVGAHTAYIAASSVPSEGRLFIGFDDEEEVTGIRELNSSANKGAIYNMNGVRVEKAKKGLFIKNGKKFVVK